jgi:uncharacterized membrane protein YgcG
MISSRSLVYAKALIITMCWLSAFAFPGLVSAQVREYQYQSISYSFLIEKDSTVLVSEDQRYAFQGEYHLGYRTIPLVGVGSIDQIRVSDTDSGKLLTYSTSRLEKTDPNSWGKYTYWTENGNLNIEWYYDLEEKVSASRAWTLQYRLHGAIGFFDDHDELYWNLATDYSVPIAHIDATVLLPEVLDTEKLQAVLYTSNTDPMLSRESSVRDGRTFYFSREHVGVKEEVTIAAGWPKGVVLWSGYAKDTLKQEWGLLLGICLIITSLIWAYYIQVIAVKRLGRGTIIAEYEPPEHLPPAQAEYLIKERLTQKAWPATVVDLAVRGHISIEERSVFSWANTLSGLVFLVVIVGAFSLYFFVASDNSNARVFVSQIVLLALFLIVVFVKARGALNLQKLKEISRAKDFVLTRLQKEEKQGELKQYEFDFLKAVFTGTAQFSTLEMRKMKNRERMLALNKEMRLIEKSFYAETEKETSGFQNSYNKWSLSLLLPIIALFSGVYLLPYIQNSSIEMMAFCILCALIIAVLGWYNPRLNQKGQLLKEDWLGFKLYLETAERYRMQNLTPDLFEKYLPYAMIFGIEEKWAKAFEGIAIPAPGWYSGGSPGSSFVGTSSPSTASFSPTAFAAGFSTSFSSSFASSGGGGASGGGGGAGGGGGGGGGGAG